MKIKEVFSNWKNKKEEKSPEDRKKRAIIELSIYAGLFIIIIIFSQFNSNKNIQNNNNINNNITMESRYEEISKNNFDSKITISNNIEELTIELRRESDKKEIISKTYNDKTENYVFIEDIYYKLDLEKSNIETIDNPNIYNGYDITFLNILNIIELINTTDKIDLKEESYLIARYKVDLTDVLNLYNNINKTDYITLEESQIIINVNYNNSIEAINLELTNFYNIIKPNTYTEIKYNLSFNNIGLIDLSDLNYPE